MTEYYIRTKETADDFFFRDSIQNVFTHNGSARPYGISIYSDLMCKIEWLILKLKIPYYSSQDPKNSPENIDILSNFTYDEIARLRKSTNTLFAFNYLMEGNSYKWYNFYQMLTLSGIKHQIPPEKIFFLSSNILEEQAYANWQKINYPNYKINVVSFNYFANIVQNFSDTPVTIDQTVSKIKENTKHFLSLNRRKHPMRVYTCYKIWKSSIYYDTLISYDKILPTDIRYGYDHELKFLLEKFMDSSPSVLDFSDFDKNWAFEPAGASNPIGLFERSLISLVSETLTDSEDGTSLFYSEKTFKAMLNNHPIMIFGQTGINLTLEKIGFKNYKNYFDLEFDKINNTYSRIDMQINQLEQINDQLCSMSVSQKIDWFLQDRETLEYNKNALKSQDYSRKKLEIFIDIVKSIIE
jgi:hypothetical protein